MKDIIRILRQQLVLCQQLNSIVHQQRELLKGHGAADTSGFAKKMEPLLLELGKLDKQQKQQLAQSSASTMAELLGRQPASVERSLAEQLLEKLQRIMQDTREEGRKNDVLLRRNMEFIDYTINVLNQTTTDAAYAPPGAAAQAVRPRKMFDASI